MTVISEPGKELVGGGQNAKYVKECKELYLGGKGIEKLRGFEPFVNLECLWLNNNKLKKINNLDGNFRIRALYAQDNQICTLRGSLHCFTFLDTLDLSNNALRDLDKLTAVLAKFNFLRSLNLSGNPCVEEPDYRLTLIHRLPSLQVLDQHVVTDAERRKAAGLIGGDVATLTVAFMRRAPTYDPRWDSKVAERSVLERELGQEADHVRGLAAAQAYDLETALFRHNPYPDIPRGRALPPNAGVRAALETWATNSYPGPGVGGRAKLGGGSQRTSAFQSFATQSAASALGGMRPGMAAALAAERLTSAPSASTAVGGGSSGYVPKDTLKLYSCKPGVSELAQAGARLFNNPIGPIRFEEAKYQAFVTQRTHGREPWQLGTTTLKL